jgi:DNA N-6-adenine-methyltransferase (Dam).
MTSITKGLFSSETCEWTTPQSLFDSLDSEFGFTLDVCATPENAKCTNYYTEAEDGLKQEWKGVCWMNPPYGTEIKKWMEKAHNSAIGGGLSWSALCRHEQILVGGGITL